MICISSTHSKVKIMAFKMLYASCVVLTLVQDCAFKNVFVRSLNLSWYREQVVCS
jgi:hypothetical protein